MSLPASSFMTIPRGNCRPKRPQRKCVHRAAGRPASPHPSDYVDEDFGIAPGRKIAPESFQFGAQLRMVVNFAVKGNNPAVAHFPHGLVAQTPVSMIASRRKPIPLLPIWSTVTLKFIDGLAWINSRKCPFVGCESSPTIWVRFLPKA